MMADMSSNNTSTINLDKNVPLCATTKKCSNLIFDGTTYHWIGNLIELKFYLEHRLKLDGVWSSPGGDAKMFKSSEV